MLMRRRNSENTTHAMSKIPARRRPPNNRLLELKRSIVSAVVCWIVDGASTVAGDELAVVVVGTLLAGAVAGAGCVTAFDVSGAAGWFWSAITFEVSGAVTGASFA